MTENSTTQGQVIDPLLSEQVSVKQYSDNIFSAESSFSEEKNIKEEVQPEVVTKQEKSDIGKDYENDGVKSMFDQINSEAEKQNKEAEEAAANAELNEMDQREVKVTKDHAKSFANMLGYGVDMLLPKLFIHGSKLISKVKDSEIYYYTNVTHTIPAEFYDNYKKDETDLHQKLKLSEEELNMIKTAFADYAQYAQIKAANPATAFWGTVAMVFLAKTEVAISEAAKQQARWQKLFNHYGIK